MRNTCYTHLEKNRLVKDMTEFDEQLHGPPSPTPEEFAIAGDNRARLTHALESLSPRYRQSQILLASMRSFFFFAAAIAPQHHKGCATFSAAA